MALAQAADVFDLLDKLTETPIGILIIIALIVFIGGSIFLALTMIRTMRASDKEQNAIQTALIQLISSTTSNAQSLSAAVDRMVGAIDRSIESTRTALASYSETFQTLFDAIRKGFTENSTQFSVLARTVNDNTAAITELSMRLDTGLEELNAKIASLPDCNHETVLIAIRDFQQQAMSALSEAKYKTGEIKVVTPNEETNAT